MSNVPTEYDQATLSRIELYIDLMKRCLTNTIYEDGGRTAGNRTDFDLNLRSQGYDWPSVAHTMVGLRRLDNVQDCVERVLREGVPGDLMETGVWRGGVTILMRALLKAYEVQDRTVWVADSFAGLPAPKKSYPPDAGLTFHLASELAVPVEQVRKNFQKYNLLDDQVKFLQGWFCDTLPSCGVENLAVLRLDGDMYESTLVALEYLYPKLSVGGFLIVDDYGCVPACRDAVDHYRATHSIDERMEWVDWTGAFWRKTHVIEKHHVACKRAKTG